MGSSCDISRAASAQVNEVIAFTAGTVHPTSFYHQQYPCIMTSNSQQHASLDFNIQSSEETQVQLSIDYS